MEQSHTFSFRAAQATAIALLAGLFSCSVKELKLLGPVKGTEQDVALRWRDRLGTVINGMTVQDIVYKRAAEVSYTLLRCTSIVVPNGLLSV